MLSYNQTVMGEYKPAQTEGDVNFDPYNSYTEDSTDKDGTLTEDAQKKAYDAEDKAATEGVDAQIDAWREFYESLPKRESKEERAAREKRESSQRKIAAITDGLTALSNMYFATQYAPDMHTSMSKVEDVRLDKLKAEREKNNEAHLQYALGIGKAKSEKARILRELKERREKKQADAELRAAQIDWYRDRGDNLGAKTDALRRKATGDDALGELKQQTEHQRAEAYKTQAERNRASAANSYSSAGKNAIHFNGNVYYNESDYAKEVVRQALEYNTRTRGRFGKDENGNDIPGIDMTWYDQTAYGSRPSRYDIDRVAAEVEARLEEERHADARGNAAPGRKKSPTGDTKKDSPTATGKKSPTA